MVESIPFQTRARTIDHLGREQIADCPTAISELWKNAYDAYAREVALHIFDGAVPVAAIVDDGHGMNRLEFADKWLVVGTESKAAGSETTEDDKDGLPTRSKQGQKGIGRLSCAALGPLLLVLSKRIDAPFVASLIDWRLFENPFLLLYDIKIPIVEFNHKNELVSLMPDLFDHLMGNVWGDREDEKRDERIEAAWNSFDSLLESHGQPSTREAIENVVIDAAFDERHLSRWQAWRGESNKGTALLIGDISFDLKAQLSFQTEDSAQRQARERLFETLSNFTDPFISSEEAADGCAGGDFRCSVTVWNDSRSRQIVSEDREFDLARLTELEHIIEGEVDRYGIFRGRARAFGEWLEGIVEITPVVDLPSRADSRIGPFHIRVGTFEQELVNTTLPKDVHGKLKEQAEKYSGFMVFRDGLRVMPYGREDNDFFEIEKRRSKHAGREFWSARRIFGRVALTRKDNPNLRDKAGREGLIDNRAAKGLRDLVTNVLTVSARRYFGTDSDIRKSRLSDIQTRNKAAKADEERKKLRRKKRKDFRKNLKALSPVMNEHVESLEDLAEDVKAEGGSADETTLSDLRERLSEFADRQREFSLGEAPRKLGALEKVYHDYRKKHRRAQSLMGQLSDAVIEALEKVNPKEPREIAYAELSRNAAYIRQSILKWSREIFSLLDSEKQRITDVVEKRNKVYHGRMLPLLEDVEYGRIPLGRALDELGREKARQDHENSDLFVPYIRALESLRESIDLEGLAAFGMRRVSELREELDRLNSLAQLGITVEIIGHEIESLDATMTRGMKEIPKSVKKTEAYQAVKIAHEDLTTRLRFLSPLKLSGDKTRRWITGREIVEYVRRFFGDVLEKNRVCMEATNSFEIFRVHEQPARLFPVFINLVNNSRYWVCRSRESERRILLEAADGKAIVADDGPGVEEEDLKHLFTLFFTRKVRGGRGVGLYLCRANLAAGGHTIQYVAERDKKILSGANFMIDFKGAEYV